MYSSLYIFILKANGLGVRKVTKVTKGATEQPAAQPAVHVSREGRDECRQAGREGKRQAGPQSE